MTQTASGSHSKYGTILRIPGAIGFTLAGIPARMHLQGAALAITLLITAQTGSYTLAGILVAVFTITRGLSGPWLSRMVDRRGQFSVMSVATLVQSVFTVLLALGSLWEWNMWVLGIFTAIAGLASGAPPAFIRARWAGVTQNRAELDTAFAWESLVESFGVAVVPLIIVAAAGFTNPTAALILLAAVGLCGGGALYLQRRTEPKVAAPGEHQHVPISRSAALRTVIFTLYYFCAAIAMGVWNILAVEQGDASSIPGLTGWILTAFAAGTMVGAFIYGAIRWKITPDKRLRLIMPVFFVTTLPAPFLGGSIWLVVASFIVGLPFIAILTSTNRAVQEAAPKPRLTELLGWLATALGVGVATGNLIGGILIDWGGFTLCTMLLIAAGVLGLATLLFDVAVARRTVTTTGLH